MMPPPGRVKVKSQAVIDAETPVGTRGASVADIKYAKALIKNRLLTKFSTFKKAFSFIDKDRTGGVTREELNTALFNMVHALPVLQAMPHAMPIVCIGNSC